MIRWSWTEILGPSQGRMYSCGKALIALGQLIENIEAVTGALLQ